MNKPFWKRLIGRLGSSPDPDMPPPGDPDWERALINRMAADYLRERRRSRRWGLIFRFAILAYLLVLAAVLAADGLSDAVATDKEHTALVDVKGAISSETDASADNIVAGLRKAFEADKSKAVILRINSPGGSPVQSGYVYQEIKRLREKHPDKPVYAVAADICASGAYYIASAADAIYVDKATLIGSIGVRLDSFGFQRALDELGIQRRLMTAGEHKGILDPFSPMDEWDREFIQGLLDNLHAQFIDAVKAGRGDRLAGGDEVFSGLFWTGEESVGLGLSDGIASPGQVAREVVEAEEIVEYSQKRDLLERLAERFGSAAATTLAALAGGGLPSWR